jgi:predicted nucleic acid-binding protein
MRYLLDTNILLRLLDENSSQHALVSDTIAYLFSTQHNLLICPQSLAEFWAVASRPVVSNGLGFETVQTREAIEMFMLRFGMLFEKPETLGQWLELVTKYQVSGKPTHDAKLVALMLTHQLEQILTINTADFARYREIQAIHPNQILEGAA